MVWFVLDYLSNGVLYCSGLTIAHLRFDMCKKRMKKVDGLSACNWLDCNYICAIVGLSWTTVKKKVRMEQSTTLTYVEMLPWPHSSYYTTLTLELIRALPNHSPWSFSRSTLPPLCLHSPLHTFHPTVFSAWSHLRSCCSSSESMSRTLQ